MKAGPKRDGEDKYRLRKTDKKPLHLSDERGEG